MPRKALLGPKPALRLIAQLTPEVDAYSQERALPPQLDRVIEAGDLWIADRNFCVTSSSWTLHQPGAAVLVRKHQQMPKHPREPMPLVDAEGRLRLCAERT